MRERRTLRSISDVYRSAKSEKEIAERVAEYVKESIPCQAVSIFAFHDTSQRLSLMYSSSGKSNDVKDSFGEETSLFHMIKSDRDKILTYEMIGSKFPTKDTYFEGIERVYSIAFTRVLDFYDVPIALIRAVNKVLGSKQLTDFEEEDLLTIMQAGNIFGVTLIARRAHERAIAFLDGVTHELLAPMSGVRNTVDFLKGYLSHRSDESPEERKKRIIENLEDIGNYSNMSISLVQGLTMFSRSGRMKRHDLDIRPTRLFADVVAKSIGNVTPLILKRQFDRSRIRCVDYSNWPMLKIDRKMMQQVFSNLLNNSVKYAHDDPEAFIVEIFMDELPDGNYFISVKDYGIGIEQQAVKHIFLPGERGNRAKEKVPTGTGIGLTTVQNLLALHDISIDLKNTSSPTEFIIRIPSDLVIKGRVRR